MPEEQPDNRVMNACPTCGGVMDVTACAPYSKVVCPSCSTPIRVRTDFNHFTLRKQIGEGGMSRVFLALDRTDLLAQREMVEVCPHADRRATGRADHLTVWCAGTHIHPSPTGGAGIHDAVVRLLFRHSFLV